MLHPAVSTQGEESWSRAAFVQLFAGNIAGAAHSEAVIPPGVVIKQQTSSSFFPGSNEFVPLFARLVPAIPVNV